MGLEWVKNGSRMGLIWPGLGLVCLVWVWSGWSGLGQVWLVWLVWSGSGLVGSGRSGRVLSGLVWSGPVGSGSCLVWVWVWSRSGSGSRSGEATLGDGREEGAEGSLGL